MGMLDSGSNSENDNLQMSIRADRKNAGSALSPSNKILHEYM